MIVSSLIILTLFFVYVLFFSGWFSIKGIIVSGNEEISEEEIRNLAENYFNKSYLFGYIKPFSNILFASSENLERSFMDKFPMIDEVSVDKNLFKKNLSIEIKEREGIGVYCRKDADSSTSSEQVCFYFDKKGIFFKESPRFSGQLFLVIEDARGKVFGPGDKFDDKDLLEKIIESKNILDQSQIVQYKNFFLPENSFGEFWIITQEGWAVELDKEVDLATQLVALKKFLEEKLSVDKRQNLRYIDLKINQRIYYR